MTNILTRALQSNDPDESCRLIQDALGITTGDVAAQCFSGIDNWDVLPLPERGKVIAAWLKSEVIHAMP
jgi:hypothetical protein